MNEDVNPQTARSHVAACIHKWRQPLQFQIPLKGRLSLAAFVRTEFKRTQRCRQLTARHSQDCSTWSTKDGISCSVFGLMVVSWR